MGEKTTGSIREMKPCDIKGCSVIDKESFYDPWGDSLWVDELNNGLATYLVLEQDGQIVGYGGFWLVVDEAQITRIAIARQHRHQGLGRQLMDELIDHAWKLGAISMTLEVRTSNLAAQKLYTGCDFQAKGIRPHYYADNHEDALIMWLYKNGELA